MGMVKLGAAGIVYRGMALPGGGGVLDGLILGAIAVFTTDRKFDWAALFAGAAAVLSFLASSMAHRWGLAIRRRWRSAS